VSVLLPNVALAVRRQDELSSDAHGDLIPGDWAAATPPLPGRVSGGGANLQGGEDVYRLAVDIALWPVKPKDIVVEYVLGADGEPTDVATGREWFVRVADQIRHSADDTVDYVRIQGQIRVGASTTP
jgi:hypothetical protein